MRYLVILILLSGCATAEKHSAWEYIMHEEHQNSSVFAIPDIKRGKVYVLEDGSVWRSFEQGWINLETGEVIDR